MKKLLLLLFLIPFLGYSQKLFFLQDKVQGQKEFVLENNLNTYIIINQGQFVTDDLLDEVKLRQEVLRRFPRTSANGYAILDWEGKGMNALVQQKDSAQMQIYINQFIRALKIAKKTRPNVKWGFYSLPYRMYGNINDSYRVKNYKLADIVKNQDFIAPSLYIIDPTEKAKEVNNEYIDKNISLALEMGAKYNKPVYPFIWQRVHPSNKIYGEQLVPISIFEEEIAQILGIRYKNTKVAGLIWWHSENYSYLNRSKSNVYSQEYNHVDDVDAYQKNMFQRYYNSIKKYLEK